MKPAGLLILLVTIHSAPAFSAPPDDEVNGTVLKAAAQVLSEDHLRQDLEPREQARAWARNYLLTLDPHRMHFLAADVDEFMRQAPSLFDQAAQGKTDFPFRVAKRFRTRLAAHSLLIARLLEERHDFSIDESMPLEYEDYAATQAECDERWRLRIKHELLMENPQDPHAEGSREFLRARYARIRDHFPGLSQPEILSLYINALAKSLDPHSLYLDEAFLSLFSTSHIANYTLGMRLAYRRGDLWVVPSPDDWQQLSGHRIVAIRQPGQQPIHLAGLSEGVAFRTITSPIAELGHAESVILDLDNPRTGERKVVACDRWLR